MPFEYGRIRLRRFRPNELDQLIELETDEEVMRNTGVGRALDPAQVEERLQRLLEAEPKSLGICAAELIEDGSFVAWVMPVEPSSTCPNSVSWSPRGSGGGGSPRRRPRP